MLTCLASAAPERVEPLKALGIDHEHRNAVKGAVQTLRRRGHVIVAVERSAGYRYMGFAGAQQMALTGSEGVESRHLQIQP